MGLLLAVLMPAAAAATVVLVVAGTREPTPRPEGSPARLAQAAERPRRTIGAVRALRPLVAQAAERPRRTIGEVMALRPVVAEAGRGGVAPSPLEPLAGGVRPAPPQRIAIPAAGVNAVVEPVATNEGRIEVPQVGRAGWYEGGARPGEPGRAVVIGHLDRRTGPGLFAKVPGLARGTGVAVTDRRGEVHRFEVIGGATVRKGRFPTSSVYGGADGPVLVIVTCGGPYTEGRGYRDNVLLYARAA